MNHLLFDNVVKMEPTVNLDVQLQEQCDQAAALPEYETCQCCYDDEILEKDLVSCPEGHQFCLPCVRKGVEIKIGEGVTAFPCLADCECEFSDDTLEWVLEPAVFARLAQRKQREEVRAAEMDDFEECPFCDFGSIPYEGDLLFTCLNPACMKISCRLCKEINHLPLDCDEVERSSEVKARTFIEDKMTEALLRTCNGCSKKFVKEEGCNLMTCVCGTLMCYLCRKTVQDHSHFRGWAEHGDNNKCLLYSTNDSLHVDVVNAAADRAKEEISAQNPGLTLRHDPTLIRPERTYAGVPPMGLLLGGLQPRPQPVPWPWPRQAAPAMQQDLPYRVANIVHFNPVGRANPVHPVDMERQFQEIIRRLVNRRMMEEAALLVGGSRSVKPRIARVQAKVVPAKPKQKVQTTKPQPKPQPKPKPQAQPPKKTQATPKPPPPKAQPPKAQPPKAQPPKAQPPKAQPPKAQPPKAQPPKPKPPPSQQQASKAQPQKKSQPAQQPPKPQPAKPKPKPQPPKAQPPKPKAQPSKPPAPKPAAKPQQKQQAAKPKQKSPSGKSGKK